MGLGVIPQGGLCHTPLSSLSQHIIASLHVMITVRMHYTFLWATAWFMSVLPLQPVSSPGQGLCLSHSSLCAPCLKHCFGSSTVPRERHECLLMGLVSGGRSGLAARTGCCQRAIVAWGVDGCLRKHAGLKRQGMGSNEQAVTEWRRGHRISQEKSWEADVRAKLNCGGRGCHFMESFVCRRGAELRVYVSPVTPTTIL